MSVGLQRLRDEPEVIRRGALDKGEDASLVDVALELDARRRVLLGEADGLKAERNAVSKQVGEAIRGRRRARRPGGRSAQGRALSRPASGSQRSTRRPPTSRPGSTTSSSGSRTRPTRASRSATPTPTSSCAAGASCSRASCRTPARSAPTRTRRPARGSAGRTGRSPEALDIIDLERGAKIAGSGFPVYKGAGAALQRALIDFFLGVHVRENGFTEIWPPAVVNTASARGTGQIPDKEDQMYVVTRDELYLVPTAEVPVTNLHRDEIFEADALPVRYAAYTPCFRREAGAAGKDTRGILRVHQFDKVEMVLFERPEASNEALEWMTGRAEDLLRRLGLAHRVLLMATRDMGFVQAKKYDLEVWAPGVERWLEVSSCSNFRDYQARRMAIRYRPAPGAKPELVHTLNGSGLALARVVAAILEVYQQPDGTVVVPEPLQATLGTDVIRPR